MTCCIDQGHRDVNVSPTGDTNESLTQNHRPNALIESRPEGPWFMPLFTLFCSPGSPEGLGGTWLLASAERDQEVERGSRKESEKETESICPKIFYLGSCSG